MIDISAHMKRGEYKVDQDRRYSETLHWLLKNYKKRSGLSWAEISDKVNVGRTTLTSFVNRSNADLAGITFERGMRIMNYLKLQEGFDGGFTNESTTVSV